MEILRQLKSVSQQISKKYMNELNKIKIEVHKPLSEESDSNKTS